MSSGSIQLAGVHITSSAELLRFLDLSGRSDFREVCESHQAHELIKCQESTKITSPSRMHALIIGINDYDQSTFNKLRGAVADAQAIENYLRTYLIVDKSRIRMLLDRDATRQGIIDALVALRNNNDIQRGDAILIYYAGHGDEFPAPQEWATESKDTLVQCLVPQDFNEDQGIHVIPDRTFGWLIDDIMEKQGDNITVILDCCHSGSGTRDLDRMTRRACIKNYSLPPGLDTDLGNIAGNPTNRSSSSIKLFSRSSPSSHILLAACSAKEAAREIYGRGQFTSSLETALKAVSPDQITYTQLLNRLESIIGQNPQLEGENKHRIVFDSKAAVRAHYSYKLSSNESGEYILEAGAADGVCPDAQFTVYMDHSGQVLAGPGLGVMVPVDIGPFKSVMRPFSGSVPSLDTAMLAVQTMAGALEELKIFVPLEGPLIPVFEATLLQMKTPGHDRHIIKLVDDRSVAHLAVERNGDEIVFIILDKRITTHGLTRCPYKTKANAEDLIPVLQGAAHYHYHLNRSYLNSENIEKNVNVEFFRLESSGEVDEGTFRPLRRISGENLLKDGIITIELRNSVVEDVFGIRITNNSKRNLYPSVFYFDNSEFSVIQYHGSGGPSKFKVDSPLPKRGGTLNLGFGNESDKRYEYFLPDGQDVDVGFLKCFFSTSPVDLSNVAQSTPFNSSRDLRPPKKKAVDAWGCILIPVVQKRVR